MLRLIAELDEFKTRDEEEVPGYAYVMDQGFDAFEQIPVTENMIGQLHQARHGIWRENQSPSRTWSHETRLTLLLVPVSMP